MIPDGLFITKEKKKIAFELENSGRKKLRYEEKLKALKNVMRGENALIHHLIWVGTSEKIVENLKSVVRGESKVSVESLDYFKSKLHLSQDQKDG